jgi:predicted site-specific integrase-resolvase
MSTHNVTGDMISAREAARILGRSPRTLIRWREEGYGPKVVGQIGKSYLYNRKDVEAFAEKRKEVEYRGRKPGKGS